MNPDPFPPSDFDQWAGSYDDSVARNSGFPFDGYRQVLDAVVELAQPAPGLSVLDLGTGTGNLAARLAALGCDLWCSDFSPAMLDLARQKLPQARFVQADLRGPWPAGLDGPFDRIVSAYVFHHFPLEHKVDLLRGLADRRLAPGGRIVIADISFPDPAGLEAVRRAAGGEWEEEFYWIASDALPALSAAGLDFAYRQVSSCAGVYWLQS